MKNAAIHHLSKKAAAQAALAYVKPGMTLGLGSGSTAEIFLHELAALVRNGLSIQGVPSSSKTEKLAQQLGIPLISSDTVQQIDLAIDGADSIDKDLVLIKGGGGALLREKILAHASNFFIVIADNAKYTNFHHFPILPLEIVPFAYALTIKAIEKKGFKGKIRSADGAYYITDSGHYIFDISLDKALKDPQKTHAELISLPGVLETGLFFISHLEVLLGREDGTVEIVKNKEHDA